MAEVGFFSEGKQENRLMKTMQVVIKSYDTSEFRVELPEDRALELMEQLKLEDLNNGL